MALWLWLTAEGSGAGFSSIPHPAHKVRQAPAPEEQLAFAGPQTSAFALWKEHGSSLRPSAARVRCAAAARRRATGLKRTAMSSDGQGSSAGGRKQAGASTNSWGRRARDPEPAQPGGASAGGTPDASRDRDWRVQLPKDMARYRDLDALMIVLDEAIGHESEGLGPPTAVSCVAAMNHLKRLWQARKRAAGAPEAERERERAYRSLFLHFLDRAEPNIPRLRLKHLSVWLHIYIYIYVIYVEIYVYR